MVWPDSKAKQQQEAKVVEKPSVRLYQVKGGKIDHMIKNITKKEKKRQMRVKMPDRIKCERPDGGRSQNQSQWTH